MSVHRGSVLPEARVIVIAVPVTVFCVYWFVLRKRGRRVSDFPYVPFEAKGWRMAMGLRPLDLERWLEVDDRRDEELELKRQLLDSSLTTWSWRRTPKGTRGVASCSPRSRGSSKLHHPEIALEVPGGEHPVVAAARLVQEDLCVLVRSDAWRLQAACVCFPSRWNLASKLGTTLDDIHRPVPIYDVELSRPTNAFFERLNPIARSGDSTGR